MPDGSNLLSAGIYTVPEAAALIGVSPGRVRGWIAGYSGSSQRPLIENQLGRFGRIDRRVAFSFSNLMEMKFIKFFEDAGVRPAYIRSIFDEARRLLANPHPFATKEVFRTDGRKILDEIVFKDKGTHLYDLKTKNYEMKTVVMDTLMDDVVYDAHGNARLWYPRRTVAPNVIMHPRLAFGRPVLRDSSIPTRTLAEAVKAEGGTKAVAVWYDITDKQVKEAVRFEEVLRKAA